MHERTFSSMPLMMGGTPMPPGPGVLVWVVVGSGVCKTSKFDSNLVRDGVFSGVCKTDSNLVRDGVFSGAVVLM